MALATVRDLVARHARPGTSEPLPGIFLSRETAPGRPELATTGTAFALIVQGAKRLTLGTQVVDYGPGDCLVTSVDLPVVGHFTEATADEPALGFGMTLKPSDIAELLLEADSSGFPSRPASGPVAPALAVEPANEQILDAAARLLRLLDKPRDLPILGPMVRRELLWLLLVGPLGDTVRQLGLVDSKLTPVSRAVQWIRENPTEPMRVDELARHVGLSVSAFHRSFRAATGSSPLQFHKQLRLQTARQLLASGAATVGRVAAEVGYESAAQFNRDYRRQFGIPPGRDRSVLTAS